MNSNEKQVKRLRRAKRTRMHIKELQVENPDLIMLTVHKSNKHIYANAIVYNAYSKESKVLAAASTQEKVVKEDSSTQSCNIDAAKRVGSLVAKRLLDLKLPTLKVAFDRSGYKYHGRVKALADAVREQGIEF